MKITSNGFSKDTKLVTKDQINSLIKLTEKHIDDAFNNILDAKFDINPKRIDDTLVSCQYCKYRDVCFRKEENITDLEKQENLDFLGGDSNGLY